MGFHLNSATFLVHGKIHLNNRLYVVCAFSRIVGKERKQGRFVD